MRCPPMAGVNASLRQAGVGQLERVDNAKKSTSNRAAEYEERVQFHTALQPAVYCKLAIALAKIRATSGQRKVNCQRA